MRPNSRSDAPLTPSALSFPAPLSTQLSALDLTGPFPSPLTLSTRIRCAIAPEIDDLAAKLRKWWPYIPRKFRPLVVPWVAAIERAISIPVSPASLRMLRGMMRRDITELAAEMWNAPSEVIAAWIEFYPDYVDKLISERMQANPILLAPADEHARAKSVTETKADTAQKQALRDRTLAVKLFELIEAQEGRIQWSPGTLALTLSSKAGGQRIKPKKVTDAAATLVRVDLARWKMRRSNQPWALELTGERTAAQRSATLH